MSVVFCSFRSCSEKAKKELATITNTTETEETDLCVLLITLMY